MKIYNNIIINLSYLIDKKIYLNDKLNYLYRGRDHFLAVEKLTAIVYKVYVGAIAIPFKIIEQLINIIKNNLLKKVANMLIDFYLYSSIVERVILNCSKIRILVEYLIKILLDIVDKINLFDLCYLLLIFFSILNKEQDENIILDVEKIVSFKNLYNLKKILKAMENAIKYKMKKFN